MYRMRTFREGWRGMAKLFESPEDVEEFFRSCAALDGPETEPNWEEHLRVMSESRTRGAANLRRHKLFA